VREKMRAPFQILAIPYRLKPNLQYCVLHRSDIDQYQFVASGGEDDEKPIEAATREISEETSVKAGDWRGKHVRNIKSEVSG
jgi:dATP pyrophosphohydrolase